MRNLLSAAVVGATFLCASAGAAEAPAYIGKRITSEQDTREIQQVIDNFQAGIKTKNLKLLTSQLLNADILFASPASPESISQIREHMEPNADGLPAGGYRGFAQLVRTSPDALEEKFYNIKITQDGHVAWVMFDYEFTMNGKTTNHGVETWQMMKSADGKWKIASVIWTSHLPK